MGSEGGAAPERHGGLGGISMPHHIKLELQFLIQAYTLTNPICT